MQLNELFSFFSKFHSGRRLPMEQDAKGASGSLKLKPSISSHNVAHVSYVNANVCIVPKKLTYINNKTEYEWVEWEHLELSVSEK